ncbi:MAG: hypothetical protein KTR21_04920 [Rhodobacteraceae bacterium]|nr:hypothetical protein [Paracoccaceae bacterium]
MAIYLLGGANGAAPDGWHEELLRIRPDIGGSGGLINLSMAAAGPLSALLQAALARDAKPGDVLIWDHADSILGCVKEGGHDPLEAMRVVEMFLRGCARRKVMVAPLISERLEEAISVDLQEIPLRLTHLFERFALPALSLTAELRAGLKARDLRPGQFAQDGVIYSTARAIRSILAQGVSNHCKSIELSKRAPQQRPSNVYPATKGMLRVALPANAVSFHHAASGPAVIGPVTTEVIEIAPDGWAEFEIEGELLGLAAVLGPDEGVIRISIDSEGFDDFRQTPISLWSSREAPVLGQVSFAHMVGRRATLGFPSRLRIQNISAAPGPTAIRADYGAAPPMELNPNAKVRVLALMERRPHQHAAPEAVKPSVEEEAPEPEPAEADGLLSLAGAIAGASAGPEYDDENR